MVLTQLSRIQSLLLIASNPRAGQVGIHARFKRFEEREGFEIQDRFYLRGRCSAWVVDLVLPFYKTVVAFYSQEHWLLHEEGLIVIKGMAHYAQKP